MTTQTRAAREQRALLAARALVDRMRTMYRELEQLTGAPIAVHRALACINGEPGIPASRLAASLGMQRSAMSHVLNDLSERGWIERTRDADDQRSIHIYITAEGRKLLQATSGRAVGNLQRAMTHLSDKDLEGVAAGIEMLLTHLPEAPTARSRPEKRSRET